MHPAPLDRNDACSNIIASILVTKAAVATFNIAPFLIGGYIDRIGLSAAQASRVLSVEIFSLALSNAAACFWLQRTDYRWLAQRLLLALIAVNISCIFAGGYISLLGQRTVVGALEGALLAIGFGLLGTTRQPERNFGFYFAVSLSVGALNVRILPMFLQTAGIAGLFINLSLYGVIALAGSFWLPRRSGAAHGGTAGQTAGSVVALKASQRIAISFAPLAALLTANYVYFIGQSGVWSFFERLGQQHSLPLATITSAISISLFVGVAGGLAASGLGLKLGRLTPLIAAIAMACASVGILWESPGPVAFTVAACLFNFGNNFGHPYILGLASKIDSSGRLTVFSGALHTAGQATGPFIAGLLVTPPDFSNALRIGLSMFALTIALIGAAALVGKSTPERPASNVAVP
jgi:hypothetical protein